MAENGGKKAEVPTWQTSRVDYEKLSQTSGSATNLLKSFAETAKKNIKQIYAAANLTFYERN